LPLTPVAALSSAMTPMAIVPPSADSAMLLPKSFPWLDALK
jgi:hypothetical protein